MSKSVWLCSLWSCSFSIVLVYNLIWKQGWFPGVRRESRNSTGVVGCASMVLLHFCKIKYQTGEELQLSLYFCHCSYLHCYTSGECADFASTLALKCPLKHTQTTEINCGGILKLSSILNHKLQVKQSSLQAQDVAVMEYHLQSYSVTLQMF